MYESDEMGQSGVPPEAISDNEAMVMPIVPEAMPVLSESCVLPEAEPEAKKDAAHTLPMPHMNNRLSNISTDERIVTIDRERSVETQADQSMNHLLDLLESLRSKKIMTGKIEGVERFSGGIPSAILRHGIFKIVIPCYECVNPPADFRDKDPNSVYEYILRKHLGAEIDFIVKGIDQESEVVVASRKEAMAIRRHQFYFAQDKEGKNLLYEGAIAEARVVSVIRAGIFVELFGVQSYIASSELSYQRMIDASDNYQNGMRVLVKIMRLERKNHQKIHLKLSVKRTKKNPYDSVHERFVVGNHYIGTVVLVDINGIFVALDGGVDCLCPFPIRGRPLIGSRVTVRITYIDPDHNRLRGSIIHSSYVRS